MTVLHDDPLCPHGVPNFQVCQACAAELAEDVDVALGKILNPPQEDTSAPPIQREGE